jgi:hypothetical protein
MLGEYVDEHVEDEACLAVHPGLGLAAGGLR